MLITNDLFLSLLDCRYKAFRKATGEAGSPGDYERLTVDRHRAYRLSALQRFVSSCPPGDVAEHQQSLVEAMRARTGFITDATVEAGRLRSQIDLLERLSSPSPKGHGLYVPVLFTPTKVTKADKLLLAFQALALSQLQRRPPPFGKIVHGPAYDTQKVKLAARLPETEQLVEQLTAMIDRTSLPVLTLNRHCAVCEFRASCQAQAVEKDDLSLLRGLTEKEVAKQRKKGVQTVTQFSYTYRPEPRRRKKRKTPRKHNHALQALALREKKVYIAVPPQLPTANVQVYLDVEGVPEPTGACARPDQARSPTDRDSAAPGRSARSPPFLLGRPGRLIVRLVPWGDGPRDNAA
jgi:predicted RecB family nuclease